MGPAMVASAAVVVALCVMSLAPWVSADEIHLKNGDRLSGRIVSEEDGRLVLEHEAAGAITVNTAFVERIVRDAQALVTEGSPETAAHLTGSAESRAGEVEPSLWERELALGYNLNRGNTIDEALSSKLFAHRKTDHNELTLKMEGYYSETDRRMTAQRYDGMGRYAFSFGSRMAWYNFYKLEMEHDRFANIDWRLTPSTGLGYWFADEADWKAMAEVGVGWERTNFRDATSNRSDAVLVPRAFVSKTLFGKAVLSEDVTVWPTLSDLGQYRLRSETALTNPLTEALDLRLTFIDEFESDPAGDTKKNDARLISSLVYSF